MPRKIITFTAIILLLFLPVFPLSIPAVYQCSAIQLKQVKNGRTYTKALGVKSLFLIIDNSEIRVFGTQSNKSICRKLGIKRIFADTLFLEDPEMTVRSSEPKLYMVKDTLMGNINLFDRDSSEVYIKVLVKKQPLIRKAALEKQCR